MANISVIIPCYNVEKYIDRCINSLVNQTIGVSNLQIIAVNDASTDNTLVKLQEWEQRYPDNILIITYEENIRQGGARNRGLEYAEGDYIGFVDSDDFVELSMFEELYDKALETDADVVRCKSVRDSEGSTDIINNNPQKDVYYSFDKNGDFYINCVSDTGNNGEYGGVWSGLYKRELIFDHQLFFPEKLRYEDNLWGELLKLYQRDEYLIDRQLYHYWVNNESTIMKRNSMAIMDKLTIEVMILEEYRSRGAFQLFADRLFLSFIGRGYTGFMYHIFLRFDTIPISLNDMREFVRGCFPDYAERIKKSLNLEAQHMSNRILLECLLSDEQFTQERQEEIKRNFLKSFIDEKV